ncbi:hypothetical protein EDD86DRAFT_201980 [Gorgonomyces haynaldii]|nr:hypothetical protein EDD86DRAFT_201980 [Gorgonomyces haynaldii]
MEFRQEQDVHVWGNDYRLLISGNLNEHPVLNIDLQGTKHYSGSFKPTYIEQITKKTGNFKKFNIFVEMLLSALKKSSNSVSIDFLTVQDLKLQNQNQDSRRIYLVVTYAVAFDRVHYPIPLMLLEPVDHSHLTREIEKLKKELVGTVSELKQVLKENDRLKHELKTSQSIDVLPGVKLAKSRLETVQRELQSETTHYHQKRIQTNLKRIVSDLLGSLNGQPSGRSQPRRVESASPQRKPRRTNESPARIVKSTEKLDRSRSSSVGSFKRFDPTEYVRQKEQKLEARSRRYIHSQEQF